MRILLQKIAKNLCLICILTRVPIYQRLIIIFFLLPLSLTSSLTHPARFHLSFLTHVRWQLQCCIEKEILC
jgi:hypothetical protein